ncbi:MAG: DUF3035 domain-containing protein [Hyphomonadaceae bacterium]|nr:DUF3035 domain-containing protein [Hyphomonadaceae bacterium]
MQKSIALLAALAAATAVSGCGGMRQAMGGGKVAPDEFRVVTRAPLVLPPDYSLRPPRPGEPRPQELQPDQEARAAIFGQDTGQNASEGERALVNRAGATSTDANIRETVDFEGASVVHRNEQFSDRVMEFQGAAADAANPPASQTAERRTAEQESVRRATGGAAVTIERRGGGVKLPGT